MYFHFIPKVTAYRNGTLHGGKSILPLCRACYTACAQTRCNFRSPENRIKHPPPPTVLTAAPHRCFQSSLYKSKYLIPQDFYSNVPYIPSSSPHNVYHSASGILSAQTSHSSIFNSGHWQTSIGIQSQKFHTSSGLFKEESKVEKTVKALKDSAKDASEKEVSGAPQQATLVPAKKSIRERVIAFLKHNWNGMKLLFVDMKISSKLVWKILNGASLTRREYNQLVRTTADMFRLVPMLVILIVPALELALPIVLYYFPNILPSTFQEKEREKEAVKKKLKAKIEMAKFLQETIKESAVERKKGGQSAEAFALFLDKIRDDTVKPNNKDILKFSKLFEDEITLDNLTRQQLRACCIMLNITPMGSDALLRFLLQMKLRKLKADDKVIQKEGIESLNISELQAANRDRGMRALGMSEDRLRDQLKQWLQLHLEEEIPTSLLLLSRALYLPETLTAEQKLGATITQLSDSATEEAKVMVAEMSGEKVDNKAKLEVIKHEEEIIATEKEQKEQETKLKEAVESAEAAEVLEHSSDEVLVDKAPIVQTSKKEELDDKPDEFTAEDLDQMEVVLEEVAKVKQIDIDHDALMDLKEDRDEYKEDLEDLKDAAQVAGMEERHFAESKAAKRLNKRVERMISRLDSVIESLQEKKIDMQEKMSLEVDTLKREQDLKEQLDHTTPSVDHLQEQIDEYQSNIININEMLSSVKSLKNIPQETKLRRIFEVLDHDKDGNIDINLALKVLELLSQEHLKLSESQMVEISKLIKHEAELEMEERQREKEEKEGLRQKQEMHQDAN